MILGCIVFVVAFFVSSVFIDYRSLVINYFHRVKIPVEYRGYLQLKDTITADYLINRLEGQFIDEIFTDSLTNNLIVVTRNNGLDMVEFYHRINSAGRLLGSFTRPEKIYQTGRGLIGPHAYYDWIITGDTTLKVYSSVNGIMSREAMRPWYRAADYVKFFSDSICVLHKDDVWYSFKRDFHPNYYSDDEAYPPKTDYAYSHMANKRVDYQIMKEYESVLVFRECPATLGDGAFSFDYFSKERYHSGFSSLFSGIGSPTGGNISRAVWHGMAYCKLRIGDEYFPFIYRMAYTSNHNEEYRMELSIYTGPNYAIISGRYNTYLVTLE